MSIKQHTYFNFITLLLKLRLYIVTLFNLHAEYIMRNAGLDEAQAAIKTARRNINNPRYGNDTTFIAESKEELKSRLMRVKSWLKIQHSNNKDFHGLQNHYKW